MHAIEAIYNGTSFMPIQPIPVKENYKVVITFIEPVNKNPEKINVASQEKLPRSSIIGILEGKVWMSDDFDAPIEDFKEYM